MSVWVKQKPRPLSTGWRVMLTVLCVLVLLVSVLQLKPYLTNTETYSWFIEKLDVKKVTVMQVSAAATAASTAITMIPDDVGTPVAQQLAQMSGKLILVLGAIYLEKYLLTIFGLAATWLFVPLSMLIYIWQIWWPGHGHRRFLARRLLAFGVMLALLIPVSVAVSSMIEDVYDESIEETIALAQQIESAMDEEDTALEEENSAKKSLWSRITDATSNVVNSVSNKLSWAKEVLNNFIDAIVVLLVTSCVIPVVVLIVLIIMVNMLLRGGEEPYARRRLK